MNITNQIVDHMIYRLNNKSTLSRKDYLKCKLGIEVALINVFKMIVLYTIAVITNIVLSTFICHVAFFSIRFFSYGIHAKSTTNCTILSLFFFVGIPHIMGLIFIPKIYLLIINLINFVFLYLFAPRKTSKNYLGSIEHQRKLKKQSLVINGIIGLLILISSDNVASLLTMGSFLAGMLIIPYNSILKGVISHE